MKKLSDFLNENSINNLYNEFPDSFVIFYNTATEKNGYLIGQLICKINVKKDKPFIKIYDTVTFSKKKIRWKNGEICTVNPKWVKLYFNDIKLSVEIKILKSNGDNSKREYWVDSEYTELNYKQFIKRRLYEKYKDRPYGYLEAYSNFQERRKNHGIKYYQALNETAKHYMIKHDFLKNEIIPKINNSIKEFKKEWKILYKQYLENDHVEKSIKELIDQCKTKESNNVIELKQKSV